ncbi:MAG: hypothetical protein KBS96_02350 [Lachnospiraceae bacterium]|nr:hypothetical protein [Candidatus Colinaster scatohippi]
MKKLLLEVTKFMYFFTAGLMLFTNYAHAYIDPSAVTYIIQGVAAVVIAAGALLTVFRHKLMAFFKKGKGEQERAEIHIIEDDDTDAVVTTEE